MKLKSVQTSVLIFCSVFLLNACSNIQDSSENSEIEPAITQSEGTQLEAPNDNDFSLELPIIVSGQYGYSNEKNLIGVTIDQSYENIPDQSIVEREVYFENFDQAWEILGYDTIDFTIDDCLVNSGQATFIIETTDESDKVQLISVIENTEPFCAFD